MNLGKYENCKEVPLMKVEDMWGTVYFNEEFRYLSSEIIPGIMDWYVISNYGKIYNRFTGKQLKQYECASSTNGKKYLSVNIKTLNGTCGYFIQTLIMNTFYQDLKPKNGKIEVNHKNGNKFDNYISYNDYNRGNLEWCTSSENKIHGYDNGLYKCGEENVHSKITKEEAEKIINLLSLNKYTSKEIVDIVGGNVTTHIIDNIRKKESWVRESKEYDFYQKPYRLFNNYDIDNFCKSFEKHRNDNLSINDNCRLALFENGFDMDAKYIETLRKVYTRKYYKNISSKYNF